MKSRLIGAVVVALLLAGTLFAGAALAVEAEPHGPTELPGIDEIGSQSEIAREHFPEPYEAPSVMPKLLYPMLIVAVIATIAILGLYLLWQPRFAEERKSKTKR
jgi:hypothetical protein